MSNTDTAYVKGDRVIVTDLRTGQRHHGVVTKPPRPPGPTHSDFMNVRYDSGPEVRVGKGFVRHEGVSND